ncbi:MAG: DNA polymerase III subunit epsilon [Xanthomonadales bacterium]|nr:DNA polymerase III subunit epsilon [Xanthomonadales bacterium]
MRRVILDTETTGLEPEQGHRVIEIGALELVDRRLTGKRFHSYLDPERDIDDGAMEVHGLTREFLQDKPRFADIADQLLAFLEGAELVIHNAPFDLGFLDYELSLAGRRDAALEGRVPVLDTLDLARDLHPGQRNNLDALCKRYEVDNSSRTLHGALLDAEILADVYLAMTGGQVALGLAVEAPPVSGEHLPDAATMPRPTLKVLRASEDEIAAHQQRLAAIRQESGHCLWLDLEDGGNAPV